jgi:NAD(P)-dependent dehydrogenase (short-subunit alcohol dehydrogenase family)
MAPTLFSINVTGVFLGAEHVIPYLVERGCGSIINLSSVAGLLGAAGHACYGASKGTVRILTKDLAAELGAQNIRVNSIHRIIMARDVRKLQRHRPAGRTTAARRTPCASRSPHDACRYLLGKAAALALLRE